MKHIVYSELYVASHHGDVEVKSLHDDLRELRCLSIKYGIRVCDLLLKREELGTMRNEVLDAHLTAISYQGNFLWKEPEPTKRLTYRESSARKEPRIIEDKFKRMGELRTSLRDNFPELHNQEINDILELHFFKPLWYGKAQLTRYEKDQ